ncbi:hypothetical protein tb265_19480 [Gemmatimonadetes bacterium T265]|nr:hypothetical protein tb265_19480 [Gemmatimonadetes bacterium T265]
MPHPAHGQVLNASLWVTQALLCLSFCIGGVMKLGLPVERLSKLFAWTGEVPKPFLRFIGAVDLAGGVGILLPELTNVLPQLTVPAALGCTVLQACAIAFHTRRGELRETPANFVFLALSAFVLWGRWGD